MKEQVYAFLREYKGTIAGVVSAVLAAVLLFTIGFWKTLLIAVLLVIGISCGRAYDRGENPADSFLRFLMAVRSLFTGH